MRSVLLVLAASIALLLATLAVLPIRTDMTEFLPRGTTHAAELVLDEARSGAATGLILAGIEGAPLPELARIARDMATNLRQTALFTLVAAGNDGLPIDDDLLARRYTLVPLPGDAFDTPALRAAMERLLRQLRSSAAPLALQYGLSDPPGAFPALLRIWAGESRVRAIDGAWFDPDRGRALLLARTRAGGMDVPGQEVAGAAIEAAFQATHPGQARLLVSGPAVFARDAARAIKADVQRIAILSTTLVLALLWWRFRAPLVISAIATPVVLSVAAGALTVWAVFGTVHGAALGFGTTMLGVCVDYPVLMIGHRKRAEPAADTRRRIGRAFVLAVTTAVLGLSAMVFSGFPGLAQLGVFSVAGLITSALVTWFVLPRLIVHANLAPVAAGDAWLPRVERLRRYRWLAVIPLLATAPWALNPRSEGDLSTLSPVPAASRALDAELRAALGAPDAGHIVMVEGPDAESVLQTQETLALEGEYAARLLPSAALQRARAAALPDPATLAARLDEARQGLPFRPDAFAAFRTAVETSRAAPPLTTLPNPRLDPLLYQRGSTWRGPILTKGQASPLSLQERVGVRDTTTTTEIDVKTELATILTTYTNSTWRWLAASTLAIVAVLVAPGLLRHQAVPRNDGNGLVLTARILASIAAALFTTIGLLTAAGTKLSLIHLVALQLVLGVGLDYALFFARRQLDIEERARTLRTLVTCNAMTLLTFGLLAACQTPLLRDIGITVATGSALAMAFAFLFAGATPGEELGEESA